MSSIFPAPDSCALALSGGLDSAVLCARLLADPGKGRPLPVFFRYASKHNDWERRAALRLAAHFGLELLEMDLRPLFSGLSSALLQGDGRAIPLSGYDEQSMKLTAVPGRNLIFASALAALAESRGIGTVALATHGGDHALYPDCRPDFIASLAQTLFLSSGGAVTLAAPFTAMNKAEIVRLGAELGLPFALTRSCYQNSEKACGRCGTCTERLEAFAANGLADPAPYAIFQGDLP